MAVAQRHVMPPDPFAGSAGDLAPGDRSIARADWSGFSVEHIGTVDHPLFDRAYARLWAQFGASGGMERRDVIAARLQWDPRYPAGAHAFRYEMLAVLREGEIAALLDHTAILPLRPLADIGGTEAREPHLVVHVSHVLIEPSMRGRGLAGWLRALPLRAARACAERAGSALPERITLVAEMEMAAAAPPAASCAAPVVPSSQAAAPCAAPVAPPSPAAAPPALSSSSAAHAEPAPLHPPPRVRSFARAGFLVPDPRRVHYAQPDFRHAGEIDRTGVRSLPLALVLRRVGREHETAMSGRELRRIVTTLYAMYAQHAADAAMAAVTALLDDFPAPDDAVALVSPLDAWRRGSPAS